MILTNVDRAREVLGGAKVDVLVAARPENVRYLTDLPLDLATALGLPTAVVLRREPFEIVVVVAPRVMAGWIPGAGLAGTEMRLYGEFHALGERTDGLGASERATFQLLETSPGEGESFPTALGAALAGLPASTAIAWDDPSVGRIVADAGWQPAADGDALIRQIRQVKTPSEIDRLRRAAEIAERVEQDLMEVAAPGADWAELASAVPRLVATEGGTPGFFTGGAGWQGGFVFAPQPMTLSPGDIVRLDLGLSAGGYWADTGRTVSLGEPSALAVHRYGAIRAGVEAALEAVRPMVTFESLYEAAMHAVRRVIPSYRRHHCGHAIGLRAYDGPLVAPGERMPLEVGMVLNVEVPYYEIGWGGLQLEETIVVEEDGFAVLTRLGRDLFVRPL